MNSGYDLQFSYISHLKPDILCADNYNELKSYQEKGDLEGYILNFHAKDNETKKQVIDLKDCLSKINQFKNKKESSYEKRNVLKKLISKYKSLQQEIDVIKPFSLGGK